MNQDFYQSQKQEGESPFTPIKNAAYYRREARAALKPFWGIAILVTFLAALLGGLGEGFSFSTDLSSGIELTDEELQSALTHLQNGNLQAIADAINARIPDTSAFVSLLLVGMATSLLFSLAFYLFVASPVKLGYQRFQLELIDGNASSVNVPSLFRYFKEAYFKSMKLNVLYGAILLATSLPAIILSVIAVISIYGTLLSFLATPEAFTFVGFFGSLFGSVALAGLGAVISTVIRIPVSYMYTFAHIILAEYPTLGVVDALRNSRNLMRGRKWKLFCLEFSFIGWILLATLTCGIGFIVLNPYISAARTAFYHDVANRDAAKEAEFPSLDPDDYINM